MDPEADPGFLRQLSGLTGGVAFRPKNVREIEEIFQRIARDIRNMYTLGYVPSAAGLKREELRRVAVDVRLPTGQKLSARTRRAYLASSDEVASDAR
jgi:hypothetical protein